MSISIYQMPNISNDMEYIATYKVGNDSTVIAIFKTLFRSDNIIVDFYLDDISENTKIISGKALQLDIPIAMPQEDLNFNYYINVVDQNDIFQSINKKNLHKYFLQFTENVPIE